MAAYVYETPNEKALSGALALVIHAVFFGMLVLSVSWQRQEAPAMMAELWSNLPPTKSEVPPPPPPPAPPKVEPEPPKPAPKVEPKPEPKVDKAEIDLREKKEKERKEKERDLAEKKKHEQQELAEKKKQELAEKKKREEREKAEALKLAQAKEAAEAKRKAQEQADALKKLAAQQAAQQAAGRQNELNKYKQAVADRIRRFITEPPNLQGNPEVEFEVIQLPGGEILGIKTTKGSGQAIWDNAVERAIQRAQPLPPPPNPTMFQDVRELHLKFRPKE